MTTGNHIRIGTSNITLNGTKSTFPDNFKNKSRLHYYSSLLNSIEINSTFYKVPLRSTLEKWAADVPGDFEFTLKLWKQITHVKELKVNIGNIHSFLNVAEGIGFKKGCLLIQFPGKISINYYKQVETIIRELGCKSNWRKAVEFRSKTWHIGETCEMLDEYDASMVLQDIPKSRNDEIHTKANFVYFRFHGPTGNYRDSYTDEFLRAKALEMKKLKKKGKEVYAYFNNTIGNAFGNAQKLQSFISELK